MEIIFHSHANKTHFHKKGCAPSLILKVRVFGTRKWPVLLFYKWPVQLSPVASAADEVTDSGKSDKQSFGFGLRMDVRSCKYKGKGNLNSCEITNRQQVPQHQKIDIWLHVAKIKKKIPQPEMELGREKATQKGNLDFNFPKGWNYFI